MTAVRTRRLDGPVDLVATAGDAGWLFARDGVGVAGRGEYARVAATDATRVLAELGDDVVAVGAHPFRLEAPWELVIPSHQVRVFADGSVVETTIGSDPPPPTVLTAPDPGVVTTSAVDDPQHWCASVARATDAIRRGSIDKVVLAREVVAVAERPWSPAGLAGRLTSSFGSCYVYSVDGLVGASPELLVERNGDTVHAEPMAGTARRSGDPAADRELQAALVASATYRREHQLTIDMVHDTLLGFASFLDDEPEPHIVELPNVAHLATRVEGRLSSPAASVLELVAALHPTPAVSGRPRGAAVELIDALEPGDRGRYAGCVGWVDGAGNGTWAVTIRCAQIDPHDRTRARLHAGCGLVADSDPVTELAESDAKLAAMLSVMESR